MEYPQSRDECLQLASKLIGFLQANLGSTTERKEWTLRNFALLDEFAQLNELEAFHKHYPSQRHEFLWDWTAYVPGSGLVIACESEWDSEKNGQRRNLKHDLEKLLSAACPVKLFICWAKKETALEIKDELQGYAATEFGVFQPGSVIVLYCIDPQTVADKNTDANNNEDRVWLFQAQDEFRVSREAFELRSY